MYYQGASYAYDAALTYIQAVNKAWNFREEELRNEFLETTKMDIFLMLNNLTLENLTSIHQNISLDLNSTWTSYPWEFPTNWTFTSNGTLPRMNYSYEKIYDEEEILKDGKRLMNFIFNASFRGNSDIFPRFFLFKITWNLLGGSKYLQK
jgi:hypothetical protein